MPATIAPVVRDGDAAAIARRFCGLTLVACDMLATGQRNLASRPPAEGPVRNHRTRHRAADVMPADFLLALARLLPPYRLQGDSGRPSIGGRALQFILPQATLPRDSSLVELLGPGAASYFYEFGVMAMTPSRRVRSSFLTHPVMTGRFIFAISRDETRTVVEVQGENLNRREGDDEHGVRSAFVTDLSVYHAEVRQSPGTVSCIFVSDDSDTVSSFSAAVVHSFVRRWLAPRLVEVTAVDLKLREIAVAPFGIEVTCVSDHHSRVTLGAWPPIW